MQLITLEEQQVQTCLLTQMTSPRALTCHSRVVSRCSCKLKGPKYSIFCKKQNKKNSFWFTVRQTRWLEQCQLMGYFKIGKGQTPGNQSNSSQGAGNVKQATHKRIESQRQGCKRIKFTTCSLYSASKSNPSDLVNKSKSPSNGRNLIQILYLQMYLSYIRLYPDINK